SFWSFNNVPSKSIAMKLMLYSPFSHSIYKILFLAFLPAINKNPIKKERELPHPSRYVLLWIDYA
ncbi:hypothetical protein, partial [Bacillus sp. B4EP4a]|uniref:hypothetical protein n=1 Tax=Bacillus sp. B4EP4a TaxID=2590665 RepID=UPI001C6710BF